MLWFMYICTTKQSLAFFPTGREPNNISFPSPVFTGSWTILADFFPQKDSLQEAIQHDYFKQKFNVSNFSKCNWLFCSPQGVSQMGSLPPPCTLQTVNIPGEDSGNSSAERRTQLSQPPLPYTSSKGLGWLTRDIALGTGFPQDWDPIASAWSMQLLMTAWSDREPPAHLESSLSWADLSQCLFLLALQSDDVYELSKPGWHCL